MSYIDAYFDRQADKIHVVERKNGERQFQTYPAEYVFYYADPKGKHRSIYNDPVTRFKTHNAKEFHKEQRINSDKTLYESDINPVFRCLANNYQNVDSPELNVAFFDIEVDFDPERGYSNPADPFNAITAISVYCTWLQKMITLVLPPSKMSKEEAEATIAKFEDTYLFNREEDLLETFLGIIEDADILSGWNSEGYDIPYTVNRVTRVLSKDDTRRFCLWNQFPKKRTFERFGAENITFDIIGRVHMDYMQLYRKYTYEERHSYSLDAIGEHELQERKTPYEGTLDQLYNNDFETFIEYNRQDTLLLKKLDDKLKFLDLANELAHANTVLLQTTMGAVAVTEQAIINEAHERGMVVPNRRERLTDEDTQAAGAYVAYPRKGLHDYIGSVDINSLYPSAIRALNMGNETIIGQLRPIMTDRYIREKMGKGNSFASAWEGLFGSLEYEAVMAKEIGTEITIDWNTGEESVHSAADIWTMIFDSNRPWMLTANGTIFTNEVEAVVPGLLKRWYAERKELQAKMRECTDEKERAFWDKRQLVKKINLNSLYGAILNPGCRFFDKRIGQSTTLTGRAIAKHMDAHINELITGEYDHVGKAIIYGDTDSCYFSAWPMVKDDVESGKMEWNKDIAVELYDGIAESVNESFPKFMAQAFHVPQEQGEIIRGGREVVAYKGLFITKKRYAVMIYDLEGRRLDVEGKPGKIKAMGLDLKRSDTPPIIQNFLSDVLHDVLTGSGKVEVTEKILQFKHEFKERPGWEKGTPKRVNNLTKYTKEEKRLGKANMPGHVRAGMNWNTMRRMNSDKYSLEVIDGMKVIVCKLKANPLGWTSIAYPTDETHIPNWFKELPFDNEAMEATIVDQKVDNLLGVLDWNLAAATQTANTFNNLFEF
jgi:DNA polymerase elongation subunit (family B)